MSSPTPKHSRQSSNIDSLAFSPARTHSRTSNYSPITPSRPSAHGVDAFGLEIFGSGGLHSSSTGLGNLADELADAWDEEECEDDSSTIFPEETNFNPARDSGAEVSPPTFDPTSVTHVTNIIPLLEKRPKKLPPNENDNGKDENQLPFELDGLPPGLIAKIDLLETLAQARSEEDEPEGGVIRRLTELLKELGGQSRVESSATRLATTHSALSTQLVFQTRFVQSLVFQLFSSSSLSLSETDIDDLVPLLIQTGDSMPRPCAEAFHSLTQLHSLTADLIQTLNYLSDTLHMSRQTIATASRRLRSVRDLVTEIQKEDEAREEGEHWLQSHNWPQRLHNRECAKECDDVMVGFNEVCDKWRARLVAQAEVMGV
ncbi:hypothetical protein BGHDH14_bghG006435000001001 [Blumeria hordei DH14]|uniref:Uncharacterized protein n=1 Tax=Blumeria graminis f. sp. hordei (strain DH14) TaxID=546991 RepID=N1JHX9_BLUG1|nr:hypothetical protein BGHDH14_bghG006435000001001 [Blumeria hordei DH14]